MHPLMESLTGAYTEEYTLFARCQPSLSRTWTYTDESKFLSDIESLKGEISDLFLSNWAIENCSLGMTIVYKTNISLDTYLKGKRTEILRGEEKESEEE